MKMCKRLYNVHVTPNYLAEVKDVSAKVLIIHSQFLVSTMAIKLWKQLHGYIMVMLMTRTMINNNIY